MVFRDKAPDLDVDDEAGDDREDEPERLRDFPPPIIEAAAESIHTAKGGRPLDEVRTTIAAGVRSYHLWEAVRGRSLLEAQEATFEAIFAALKALGGG